MDYTQNFLILIYYLHRTFGTYPTDIIRLILMILYKPIKIICHESKTVVNINNKKIYSCGEHYKNSMLQIILGIDDAVQIKYIKCGWNYLFVVTDNGIYFRHCSQTETNRKNLSVLSSILSITKKAYFGNKDRIYVWINDYVALYSCYGYKLVLQKSNIKIPGEIIKIIKNGRNHTIILTQSGNLYSWGENSEGQLGLGHYESRKSPRQIPLHNVKKIKCGANHSIVITFDNKVYVWGSNQSGQLGLGSIHYTCLPTELILPDRTFRSVDCGTNHTICLTDHNQIYTFGSNKWGQLGLGDYRMRRTPQNVPFKFPWIKSVRSRSTENTFVITLTSDIYGWGMNHQGSLGLGDKSIHREPTKLKF